ncbi:Acyl-coenzyme A thioesterase 13 [Eumeta japonica]|uniref:Acyl-coenzyme A thioesterase 13 n=1 Tax=Eumeta variegata TaxID=151549 RepID=A0A4C1Y845_EUMVA|nr:Acyl-coenzyme A thioesterase 13 [Eumeta japonica]
MSGSTTRGLSLIKSIQKYVQAKPNQWDSATVLSKELAYEFQVKLDYVGHGVIRGKFTVEAGMCNSFRYLHGGYTATLIDVISVFSCLSDDRGKISWSTGLNMLLLNAVKEGEEVLFESTPLVIGKGSVVEVTLRTSKNNQVAARGTVALVMGNEHIQKACGEALYLNLDGN